MCIPVDPHDIGAVSLFQFLIAALEILHHPIFPVLFSRLFIGLTNPCISLSLLNIQQAR